MTFGRPEALWLLLIGVPLVAMHLYRGRIRRIPVPTLLFWDQVLVVEERTSALRKLRHLLGLLVALAALAVLTSALSDPTVPGFTPEPRRFVLVVDTSPEMAADSRLEAARGQAKALLGRMARRDVVSIFDGAGLVEPATADAARRLRALDRIPRDVPTIGAGHLLQAAQAADPAATLLVLSSRSWPAGKYRLYPIGLPRPNAGFTDMRAAPGFVEATAVNASDLPVAGSVEIRNRGTIVTTSPIALGPRERKPVSFDLAGLKNEEAFIELRLKVGDAIAEDDVAAFAVAAKAPISVTVVSEREPDPHLWSALELLRQEGSILLTAVRQMKQPSGVVIYDRVAPPDPLPDGGYLMCGAGRGEPLARPKIVDWDRESPVHRWVDYSDVICRQARIVEGEPLIVSDRGPVASTGRRQGMAWIRLGFVFDVTEIDFAMKPSFPIFLKNAVRWLAVDGPRAFPVRVKRGLVLRIHAPLESADAEFAVTDVTATPPVERRIRAERGEVRIPTAGAGLLKIQCGTRTEWVAVDGGEPIDVSRIPAAVDADLPAELPKWRDLPWPPVAAAIVLALLLVEWLMYQRGWI